MPTTILGALDIGGTHVTAALADAVLGGTVVRVRNDSVHRHELASDGTADEILSRLVEAGQGLELPPDAWLGIAIPGPFDTERGVGMFRSVGKFDSLYGVDLRTPLARGLGLRPERLVFGMDSHAFLRGEWVAGAAAGHDRAAGITLGTGVGSAFLAAGEIVASGNLVPPEGRADLLEIDGRPLEQTVSRRALLAAYDQARGSAQQVDVREIFDRARQGDDAAAEVIGTAFGKLAEALGPWLTRFDATVLVVGGAMSGSWDLIEPALAPGLDARLAVRVAKERELSLLVGAAWQCARIAAAARGQR